MIWMKKFTRRTKQNKTKQQGSSRNPRRIRSPLYGRLGKVEDEKPKVALLPPRCSRVSQKLSKDSVRLASVTRQARHRTSVLFWQANAAKETRGVNKRSKWVLEN
mmetsp:Transcript_13268/g.24593  ORF Transcript_13268/g.24593 Transcript_13268/m.24593 type:complete len:105 (+) Transcript_13268:884-1198(+)